jgi:hypothetical protein
MTICGMLAPAGGAGLMEKEAIRATTPMMPQRPARTWKDRLDIALLLYANSCIIGLLFLFHVSFTFDIDECSWKAGHFIVQSIIEAV